MKKILLILMLYLLVPTICLADMSAITDTELEMCSGEGFSEFTIQDNVVRGDFNIDFRIYADIESMKMGHHLNGWDQDWTSVTFGSQSDDIIMRGLFIETEFSDVGDQRNRILTGFRIGFSDVSGNISGNFNSYSGQLGDLNHNRSFLGNRTFRLSNSELSFTFDMNRGILYNLGDSVEIID